MTYYPVRTETLESELSTRIVETEAELKALKDLKINTAHKTLTNRAIEGGKIGDYIGIGKALYVNYVVEHRFKQLDITAYSYEDENGKEIGSEYGSRISRTITPLELQAKVDDIIQSRKQSLVALKRDLKNASKIVDKYNKLMTQVNTLTDSLTWASRGVLK